MKKRSSCFTFVSGSKVQFLWSLRRKKPARLKPVAIFPQFQEFLKVIFDISRQLGPVATRHYPLSCEWGGPSPRVCRFCPGFSIGTCFFQLNSAVCITLLHGAPAIAFFAKLDVGSTFDHLQRPCEARSQGFQGCQLKIHKALWC